MSSIAARFASCTNAGGVEDLEVEDDPNFDMLRSIIHGMKPNLLNRRTTTQDICRDDSESFISKIPVDMAKDVVAAHRDIALLFPEWLAALKLSSISLLMIAGNGSKTLVCNMFANYLLETSDFKILEMNPNSPSFRTSKAISVIRNVLAEKIDESSDESRCVAVVLHSADNPVAQDLIYQHLLPLRVEEPRLKLIFALDTLLIHAQIQLWGIRENYLLKDGIHTFLDFRLELLLTWLRNRPLMRQLLGESLTTSQLSLSQTLEKAKLTKFCTDDDDKDLDEESDEDLETASSGETNETSAFDDSDSDDSKIPVPPRPLTTQTGRSDYMVTRSRTRA